MLYYVSTLVVVVSLYERRTDTSAPKHHDHSNEPSSKLLVDAFPLIFHDDSPPYLSRRSFELLASHRLFCSSFNASQNGQCWRFCSWQWREREIMGKPTN